MLDYLITHFYLPKNKRLKSGEVPVYCRITLNGIRATFSTGIYVYEDCWNAKIKLVHPTDASANLVNPRLLKIQEKVQQTYFKLESLNKEITKIAKMYACPMHPDVTSKKAGKCSKCGMDMTEKK